jgi:hypothetical protein
MRGAGMEQKCDGDILAIQGFGGDFQIQPCRRRDVVDCLGQLAKKNLGESRGAYRRPYSGGIEIHGLDVI